MPNFLSSFSGLFSGLTKKRSRSVLGIDVGSSSIKVVQLSQKNGHPVLDTYAELSLGQYAGKNIGEATGLTTEKIIEAIGDILKEKDVNITTRACGVAIPFSSSFISVIDVPMVSKADLDKMIPIEARKYIPVPISEVALDWYIIPKDKSVETEVANSDKSKAPERLEVLIVALHNDTISRYKEMITQTALDASFFEIEIFSTMRSILDQEISPVLLVDMGATNTKLYIVERGILRASHMINKGSQSITDELSKSLGISVTDAEYLKREKGLEGVINGIEVKNIMSITLDYIFSEINHTILAYQKKYTKNVSKVVLVGGGSALKGIADFAKNSFQTEVEAGNPFSKVVAPAFLEKVLRETGPEFAVAVGAALRRLQELD
ncbi:MAG: type IV pilus assembly protein PilM [Minisyncoccia bacterium]